MSKRRTRQQWKELVDQQGDSGLSGARFCREYDIGYASLCKWRRRLAESDASASAHDATSGFVDVSSLIGSADSNGIGSWAIVLSLGNGVELRLTQTP